MCKPPVSEVRHDNSVASPCGEVDLELFCAPELVAFYRVSPELSINDVFLHDKVGET